jgi:hypothetical protein
LAIVAVIVVAADRIAAYAAGRVAGSLIAQRASFAEPPSVSIHGVPFLTQALRGSYQDVEVSGSSLQLGPVRGVVLDAHLRGVGLPLANVVHRDVTQLPISQVDGTVTVPLGAVSALTGISGLTLTGTGGALTVAATEDVDGRAVTVRGTGRVAVVGGQLRLQVDSIDSSDGGSLPSSVRQQLLDRLNVPINLPSLPYRLRVDSVRTTATALVVQASAADVVVGLGSIRS